MTEDELRQACEKLVADILFKKDRAFGPIDAAEAFARRMQAVGVLSLQGEIKKHLLHWDAVSEKCDGDEWVAAQASIAICCEFANWCEAEATRLEQT